MIRVLAMITAKPGMRDAVLEVFRANVPTVLAEPGCLEYAAMVDVPGADPAFGPDTYVVVEQWASMEALKVHGATPHMAAYREKTKELVAGRKVHVLTAA